jgi:hypothetical protein
MGDTIQKQKNQEQLRARAQERMERGTLPRAKAIRTWGGRGSGLPCSLCDSAILPTEPEMELEFEPSQGSTVLRFHLQCQTAWEAARNAASNTGWTLIKRALPPYDEAVEARLSLGEDRRILLSVVLTLSDRGDLWLNAVTREPLPQNWKPLEWRSLSQPTLPVTPAAPAMPAAPAIMPKKSA